MSTILSLVSASATLAKKKERRRRERLGTEVREIEGKVKYNQKFFDDGSYER